MRRTATPLERCREERLLHGVFRGGEVAKAADDRTENLRRELAQQILARGVHLIGRHISVGGALITSRTSMGRFNGVPPGPGAADARAAIS
jgi:hypothetical protein